MRKLKKSKGITLIALIITIIVMLILVAVIINEAINGGIFTKTNKTVKDTERELIYEQIVGVIVLDNNGNLNVDETGTAAKKHFESNGLSTMWTYKSETNSGLLTVTGKRETYKIAISTNGIGTRLIDLYDLGELKIGDYVAYTPKVASAYDPDEGEGIGAKTGWSTAQSIAQDNLAWRVLGVEGTGENRKILLISATPTTSSSTSISFYGYIGYNNYEEVLNDTCAALYSNAEIGATARSITMDDIDTYLGGDAYIKSSYSGYGGYGKKNTIPIESKFTPSNDNKKLTKQDTMIPANGMSNTAYDYIASDVISDLTKLSLLQGNSTINPFSYWVAVRSTRYSSYFKSVGWNLGFVIDWEVVTDGGFAESTGYETGDELNLRPVVSLNSNVTEKQVKKLNSGSNDWNDPFGRY